MRKSVLALFVTACCLVLVAGNASATAVTFGDGSKYWLGWGNGGNDDNYDTIGTPNLLGGTAEISGDSYLTKLTFKLKAQAYLDLWHLLYPGDLFIDADADNTWDYYVDLLDTIECDGTVVAGDGKLYSISQPLKANNTDGNYLMSKVPSGYGYRENHPVGINGDTLVGGGSYFSGWPSQPVNEDTVLWPYFTFGDRDILLGSSFIIGWTQTCANDVVYEKISNPIPEPATMLLLGTGLICLAGLGRKKFNKGTQ